MSTTQIKNGFIKLFYEYFEYLKPFLEKEIIDGTDMSLLDLFRYKKIINKSKANNLLEEYQHIKEKIINIDEYNWLMIIYDFIGFINFSEKSLLYTPNNIEVSIIDKSRYIKIHNAYDIYDIEICFEKSQLPLPGLSCAESSVLSDFINNESKTVYFINIKIPDTKTEFKFISYEVPKFDNLSDEILLYKIKKDISKVIMAAFDSVMDHIMKLYDYNIYISWKEVLKSGLWIR